MEGWNDGLIEMERWSDRVMERWSDGEVERCSGVEWTNRDGVI